MRRLRYIITCAALVLAAVAVTAGCALMSSPKKVFLDKKTGFMSAAGSVVSSFVGGRG